MFDLQWTETSLQAYRKLEKSPKPGLFKQVHKTLTLLKENPRHPSLKTHVFDSKVFEAYVQNQTPGAYRVFWCYGPENTDITIIAITQHP
ncbi:MAG: hypothetical protein WCK49_07340 [Myxococcaceae bacterium]